MLHIEVLNRTTAIESVSELCRELGLKLDHVDCEAYGVSKIFWYVCPEKRINGVINVIKHMFEEDYWFIGIEES